MNSTIASPLSAGQRLRAAITAQVAIVDAMKDLQARSKTLTGSRIGVEDCTKVLNQNLAHRDQRFT